MTALIRKYIVSGVLVAVMGMYCVPYAAARGGSEGSRAKDAAGAVAPGIGSSPAPEKNPHVADARFRGPVRQVVREMKKTGYDLDQIVGMLKDDRYKASEISMACLNNGFNGTYVHAALLSAGFSRKTADAAVPVALRRAPLLFPADRQRSEQAARPVFIDPNPLPSAPAATRPPVGVAHVIARESVGLSLDGPQAAVSAPALERAVSSDPAAAAVDFFHTMEKFRNAPVAAQADFFAASTDEDRVKIAAHLSAEQKKALYQALSKPLRAQTEPLFRARRVEIEVADTSEATTQDVHNLINWLHAAEQYVEAAGFPVSLPAKIIIGASPAGDYATPDEWRMSRVSFELVGSRLIKLSLAEEYPELGYQATEAFAAYYLGQLLAAYGVELSADTSPAYYDAAQEDADSITVYEAYAAVRAGTIPPEELAAVVERAAENYRAMAQSMQEIALAVDAEQMSRLVKEALGILSGIYQPRGMEIVAAFLQADQHLHKAALRHLIQERFAAHNIRPMGRAY